MVRFINRYADYEVERNPRFLGIKAEKVVNENIEELFLSEIK